MSAPPVTGFRLDAVHTFQVRTLKALGFQTRVALSNASDEKAQFSTTYRIDVSVYGPSRKRERFFEGVATLEPKKKIVLDCAAYEDGYRDDIEIIFHLIPLRHAAVDGTVTISREELFFLFTVQDHYVEYYRGDGFASGVLYQSGAFNYAKFSKEATTIIQAPKGYVSNEVDTLVSLLNSSLDPAYAKTARMKCQLRTARGRKLTWTEDVPPFAPVLISLRDRALQMGLTLTDEPEFLYFIGVCDHATLVPLTINRDLRTGNIGIEHSLPPIYYATSVTGPTRAQTIASLAAMLEEQR